MQKKYIFFDFDGTLVDTSAGIFDSLIFAFEKMGEPILSESDMRKYIGPPLEWSFMTYNNMNEQSAAETTKFFRINYKEKGVLMHSLYEGIREMLEILKKKGKILAVATSKPEHFAVKILKEYNLYDYFDVVSGATLDGSRSSKNEVLSHAVSLVNPENLSDCVLVGDTDNDVVGALQVGIDCIGILYGFGTKEKLEKAGATVTLETPADVANIID